jgi:N-acetyl-anhydromuramyl-L-alanine amidase AmpD
MAKTGCYKSLQSGNYDDETRWVVEAFNRHYSPEVFVKGPILQNSISAEKVFGQFFFLIQHKLRT